MTSGEDRAVIGTAVERRGEKAWRQHHLTPNTMEASSKGEASAVGGDGNGGDLGRRGCGGGQVGRRVDGWRRPSHWRRVNDGGETHEKGSQLKAARSSSCAASSSPIEREAPRSDSNMVELLQHGKGGRTIQTEIADPGRADCSKA